MLRTPTLAAGALLAHNGVVRDLKMALVPLTSLSGCWWDNMWEHQTQNLRSQLEAFLGICIRSVFASSPHDQCLHLKQEIGQMVRERRPGKRRR